MMVDRSRRPPQGPKASLISFVLILALSSMSSGAEFVYAVGAGSPPLNLPNIEGGYLSDSVTGLAVDGQGYVYMVGTTYSPVFPTGTPIGTGGLGVFHRSYPFVAKLSPDGSRFVYVKILPGGVATSIAVDREGNTYIAGGAFVLKLDPSGSQVYLADLGGRNFGVPSGLALDGAGNAYVVGTVFASSIQSIPGVKGREAVTVAKVNAAGTALAYSVVLSGSQDDYGSAIAVDAEGAAYVTGNTDSPDFPVTAGAFQRQLSPIPGTTLYATNAFATKLNPAGTTLVYSTYLGGRSTTFGNGIAVDADGNAYVTGGVPVYAGAGSGQSAFVTKLNSTGSGLIYSARFAAAVSNAIAVDAKGNAHITGRTFDGLPVYHAFQPSFYSRLLPWWTASGTTTYGYATCSDGFVAGLDQSGSGLLYSTYLNGYQQVSGLAIAVDQRGNTYAGGFGVLTLAATNALSNDGAAFVVKLRQTGAPPFFTRQSVANSADFGPGLVEPGGLASIFATGLTGVSGSVEAPGYPLPTELAGVQVKIGGIPARLLSVSDQGGSQQINLQVPFEASGPALDIEISQNGLSAWVPQVDTKSTPPGLFTLDGIYGAFEHGADYSVVTPQSPAQAGEIVVLYGTGFGPVTPAVASGVPAPAAVAATERVPTVTVGGQSATVEFSGLTPGLTGVYQINIRVPLNASSGDQDVVASFPPYQVCCIGGGGALRQFTVVVDSKPAKVPVR